MEKVIPGETTKEWGRIERAEIVLDRRGGLQYVHSVWFNKKMNRILGTTGKRGTRPAVADLPRTQRKCRKNRSSEACMKTRGKTNGGKIQLNNGGGRSGRRKGKKN